MKTYFLTGLIASGKSSVLEQLKNKGCQTISMDALAREVVRPGSPCLHEIAAAFGPEALLPGTDELNRSYLASVVFGDSEALKRLEAIELPAILALLEERLDQLEGESRNAHDLRVVEVPVLSQVESLFWRADQIIYLEVPYQTRLKRALCRGMEQKDFMARNHMLPDDAYLKAKATVVIEDAESLSPQQLAEVIVNL